jgi:hypothetical protein
MTPCEGIWQQEERIMTKKELDAALRVVPYKPIRLYVSGGATFDIRHPELCVPGFDSTFIGIPPTSPPSGDEEPGWDRFTIVDNGHIIRLEPVATARTE